MECEKDDVLIIGHRTVLQCLFAYLMDRSETTIPNIDIPENTLIEIQPLAYGCQSQYLTVPSYDDHDTVFMPEFAEINSTDKPIDTPLSIESKHVSIISQPNTA